MYSSYNADSLNQFLSPMYIQVPPHVLARMHRPSQRIEREDSLSDLEMDLAQVEDLTQIVDLSDMELEVEVSDPMGSKDELTKL